METNMRDRRKAKNGNNSGFSPGDFSLKDRGGVSAA